MIDRRLLIKLVALSPFVSISTLFAQDKIEFSGKVFVNGEVMTPQTKLKKGDVVETLKGSTAKFKINKNAFLLREKSRFKIENTQSKTFTLLTGGVLAVFAKGKATIQSPTVAAGIRGTGIYLEVEDSGETTYACTCYGEIHYEFTGGEEIVDAGHHDKPFRFTKQGEKVVPLPAGMEKHTDEELIQLEQFVDRLPPFVDSWEMFTRGFKKLFGIEYKNDMY